MREVEVQDQWQVQAKPESETINQSATVKLPVGDRSK